MKKLLSVLTIVLLASAFVFASGEPEAATESISLQMGGSTTVLPAAEALIEVYTQDVDTGAELGYTGTGSSDGIRGVLSGALDVAGASRGLKDSEIADGAVAYPIAVDGLGVVVNASVSVTDLTIEQIAQIFHGDITNWSEVGGEDKAIAVVTRDEASGTRGAFVELVLEEVYEDADATFTPDATVVASNGDMASTVATKPDSIGYASLAVKDVVLNEGGRLLSIGGVEDSVENILAGDYPLSRQLFLVTKGEATGDAKVFIDWVLSEVGQEVVATEYIPIR